MIDYTDMSRALDLSRPDSDVDARGTFIRRPSSFRNFIEKGGRFPPEKGSYLSSSTSMGDDILNNFMNARPIPPLCRLHMPLVLLHVTLI